MEFTGERFIVGKGYDDSQMAAEHWQRYFFSKEIVKNKIVLDIACGAGYGADLLSTEADYVYGVDISDEAIEYASNNYKRDNLEFLLGDICDIPLKNYSVDIVISFETLEHVSEIDQKNFLTEVRRVLRPGGILLISSPNREVATDLAYDLWGYKNEFHIKEHYHHEFVNFLSSEFRNIKILFQSNEVVQLLRTNESKKLDIILSSEKNNDNAQNFIAFCSDEEIFDNEYGSVVLDNNYEYQRINREYSKCVKLLNEADVLISNKESEILRLNEYASSQIQILSDKISAFEIEANRLNGALSEITAKNRNKDIVIESLNIEVSELLTENSKIKSDYDIVYFELYNLLSSRSWKITYPLRVLMTIIKKMINKK